MKNSFTLRDLEKITDGNMVALKELLEVFVKESALQIQQLELFLSDGDLVPVKQTAHKIKSSLALLGLDRYRPLAEKIEKAQVNEQTIKEDVTALISLYKQVLEELKSKLKELY